MLRTGLPKGRLLPRSEAAVTAYGEIAGDMPARHRFLRMPDIPDLVAEGLLDVGIAGEEWLVDSGADVVRVAPLCWYHVRICALHLPGSAPQDGPVRVVSEYPRIAHDFGRARWGEDFSLRTVRGSVEHYLPDLADVAVECVETGESMRRKGLVATETLFEADVWMVCSHGTARDGAVMDRLKRWAEAVALDRPPGHESVAISAAIPRPGAITVSALNGRH
ncbi:ATP phosphoribosyltransferase [Streptomyces sp. 2131.1]|uniref:hypothetical protein n=1 Tax=Streptomyces sp. 2131.1 TaxID=1855346 RepID=UPI000896E4F5|nr:hypothetical protein [Streptomyces sp. 2131.1]SEE29476.1 ATP phosphoribosyltransferase [Streptomyces sp. 2131.1]